MAYLSVQGLQLARLSVGIILCSADSAVLSQHTHHVCHDDRRQQTDAWTVQTTQRNTRLLNQPLDTDSHPHALS